MEQGGFLYLFAVPCLISQEAVLGRIKLRVGSPPGVGGRGMGPGLLWPKRNRCRQTRLECAAERGCFPLPSSGAPMAPK